MAHKQSSKKRRGHQKKGVVLLIIVTLLTLFIMIGITFALMATSYKDAGERIRSAGTYGDRPERELDLALAQLLYGSSTLNTVSPHNLLADLYDHDGTTGEVQSVTTANGGQLVVITANLNNAELTQDFYSGRVLTFTSGEAAGMSMRVLGYDATTTPQSLLLDYVDSEIVHPPTINVGDNFGINGAPFNGTGGGYRNFMDPNDPGQTAAEHNLDAKAYYFGLSQSTNPLPLPVALLPHYAGYPQAPTAPVNLGGFDEPYDAADYQNMFLAMMPPSIGLGDGSTNRGQIVLLPSFHRPDLVQMWFNYMINDPGILGSATASAAQKLELVRYPYGRNCVYEQSGGDDEAAVSYMDVPLPQRQAIIALKRSIIFRPLREDHPGFTGGNFAFEPDLLTNNEHTLNLSGGTAPAPYDVDNDGDGIADSIWVDPGLPVVTSRDGRKYKRLFAYLVVDLDGRINVNAHGSLIQVQNMAQASQQITDSFAGVDPMAPTPVTLPRGLGFGPAEVDFRHLFNNNVAAYQAIFVGQNNIPGRYGQDGNPGRSGQDDPLSAAKTLGMPFNHVNPLTRSSYTSPPDVWGRGAMALDYYGMPLWVQATNVGTGERVDDPYEMHFAWQRPGPDFPFTPAEQEALLRYHDPGADSLSSRFLSMPALRGFLASGAGQSLTRGSIGADQRIRNLITTLSSEIPAPAVQIPKELRTAFASYRSTNYAQAYQNAPASVSLLELYRYRLEQGGVTNFNDELDRMVPFEFRHGQLLNVNRELGNGQHDLDTNMPPTDVYGVVDDIGEARVPANNPQNEQAFNVGFDHLNDYPQTLDPRIIMARHLFCLMMVLKDDNDHLDTDGDGTPNTALESARMIAQWAVNAVDFRDADGIMTPFEYDTNPWNGWEVDGDPTTDGTNLPEQLMVNGMPVPTMTSDRAIVWGVERPELLLTEAVAWHDRRTEDLANDDGSNGMAGTTPTDESFDTRLKPRGALFIELFNPWFDRSNGAYDHKARELYSNPSGPLGVEGVELNRVNTQGSAVWRMLIVKDSLKGGDPDAPQPENWTNPPGGMGANPDVDRSVYFAPAAAITAPASGHGQPYYPPAGLTPAPVMPGRYAIVGGADEVDTMVTPNIYTTYVGRVVGEDDSVGLTPSERRRIQLIPSTSTGYGNPDSYQLRVYENSKDYAGPPTDPLQNDYDWSQVQPMVAIPITDPRSLSVSEPIGGYPNAVGGSVFDPLAADGDGAYAPVLDTPLDDGDADLRENRTTPQYRQIFLQRLANPLLAWNSITNPYITIDATDVDMTAFNGVAADAADMRANVGGFRNFQTFQRGGSFDGALDGVPGYPSPNWTTRGYRNLWEQGPTRPAPTQDSPTGDPGGTAHYFSYQLFHTLGYLNCRYWPYFDSTSGVAQGYLGAPSHLDREDNLPRAFPWLTHLDRPLTSPMELLNVSSQSSSRLLQQFRIHNSGTPWPPAYDRGNTSQPYAHLLNFFQTTTDAATPDAPNLCRIFDYLEVPSPYIGAEKYYNPQEFQAGTGTINMLRPPYCKVSRFRDPGRININTIYDSAVWEAIAKSIPGLDPQVNGQQFFNNLISSRQGYAGLPLFANPGYPSLFSNPFRTADSADMMPPIPTGTLRATAPNGTLLRSNPTATTQPMLVSDSTQAFEEAGRNPYFRFQGLQKVSNMVTTRSNCFAVWITVGYFEVIENRPTGGAVVIDAAHPDGYQLGQEIGADGGGATRHRSFFIIDRSIPVAYEPGKRHNTDRMILLRRYIE